MASSKDTFEAKTFAANSFACGTFRGLGVTVTPAADPAIRIIGRRTTVTLTGKRTTITLTGRRTGEI